MFAGPSVSLVCPLLAGDGSTGLLSSVVKVVDGERENSGCAESRRTTTIPESFNPPTHPPAPLSQCCFLLCRYLLVLLRCSSSQRLETKYSRSVFTYLHFYLWCMSEYVFRPRSVWMLPDLIPAGGQQELLSSGSGRSATGCPCGAIPWSLLTGWSGGGPGRPQTVSGGCRQCRRPRLRLCAREG